MKQSLHPKAIWIFFFQNILLVFLAFLFFLMPLFIFSSVLTILLIFALFIIIFYYWAKLTYYFWKYEITEDAVRIERGVVWKKYISIPYERIQNVDIYRGVLARIFGLSALNIQTAGYSGGGGRYGLLLTPEGNLPGLSVDIAEKLRDDLIKRAKGTRQGI